MSESARGIGGGVRAGYRAAATIAAWTLESVGPSLYVLRADCYDAYPAVLAFGPLTVWIARGNLAWSWTTDDLSVIEGRLEAVVGQPTLGPLPREGGT